jgi:hypothetical protein
MPRGAADALRHPVRMIRIEPSLLLLLDLDTRELFPRTAKPPYRTSSAETPRTPPRRPAAAQARTRHRAAAR